MTVHRFRAMGCEAVVAGGDPPAVASVLAFWEGVFSPFRADSELSRVNASPAPVQAVSPFFGEVVSVALAVAAETDGLVDPTLTGEFGRVRLAGRILHRPSGLALDLNGVVKALAVDEAAARLEGEGFVSVGGDLAVRGAVDVGLPGGDAVRVVSGGLATSGVTTRGRHLIDPRTALPAVSPWEAVTVSGASCLAADVAAKAAFLLADDGPDWLDARGLPGRFLSRDGDVVCNTVWQSGLVCT